MYLTDQYDEIIKEGDYITYPSRQGSTLYMRTAIIKKIEFEYDWLRIEHPKIYIIMLNNFGCLKKVVLTTTSLITIIPKSKIPLRISSLFNKEN